jgi:hypothetical protein
MPRMKRHEGMLFVVIGTSLCAAACGKGGGGDWTSRPIKPITVTVDGVKLTIDAPDGMRQKEDHGQLRLDFLDGEYVKTPDITIGIGGYAKTIDDFVKTEPKVDSWVRKEALPDGYVASYENPTYKGKEDYLVYVNRTLGDKVVTCNVRLTPWDRGATVKDKIPQAEKICLSIKLAK